MRNCPQTPEDLCAAIEAGSISTYEELCAFINLIPNFSIQEQAAVKAAWLTKCIEAGETVEPIPQIDVEPTGWVCRDGTWQYDVLTFTNGVLLNSIPVDSGLTCDLPAPLPPIDFEVIQKDRCDAVTGTIWREPVVYSTTDPTDATTATEISVGVEYDTGILCKDTCGSKAPLTYFAIDEYADPVSTLNPSFEDLVVGSGSTLPAAGAWAPIPEGDVLGWETTDSNNIIELWGDGFRGVPAANGGILAELNYLENARIFQTITLPADAGILQWRVKHRGRFPGANAVGGANDTDTAIVLIGNAASPSVVETMTSGSDQWYQYEGTVDKPAGETQILIGFEGISTQSSATEGNLLDDVELVYRKLSKSPKIAYINCDDEMIDLCTGELVDKSLISFQDASAPIPPSADDCCFFPVYGCVQDIDGNTVNGFTLVDKTGSPSFAPISLTDIGFSDCCSSTESVVSSDLWTLFSKLESEEQTQFENIVHVADVDSGNNADQSHPITGDGIGNWNVFAICSPTQPSDDSNGHVWTQGDWRSFNTFTSTPTGEPTPSC